MTEQEWMACADPRTMLDFLRGKASDRQLRLFAVAGCRRVWNELTEWQSRRAVEVAERYAGGLATMEDLGAALTQANIAAERRAHAEAALPAERRSVWVPHLLATAKCASIAATDTVKDISLPPDEQAELLREIIGNPFRAVQIQRRDGQAWLTPTVLSLARPAYEERVLIPCTGCGGKGRTKQGRRGYAVCFECDGGGNVPSGLLDPARLAVLTDALEESGCTDTDILSHLRSPGPHVRGCHVVDAILGLS